jgi:glycosidase
MNMSFRDVILSQPRPGSIRQVELPRRETYFPSPADWRDEVIYFLLPDRFSDGKEGRRPMLDRTNLQAGRPPNFRFDKWAQAGGNDKPNMPSPTERFQGGTIAGIRSKLDYLEGLRVTTLWIGPVFKQRVDADTYHGYAIQDFLEVDPHFGTRGDLVDLVDACHARGLRVILDVVFNHSGTNWVYADGQLTPPLRPFPDFYQKGAWFDGYGGRVSTIAPDAPDAGVWPTELQRDDYYTRAGGGAGGDADFGGDIENDHAEFRRTDMPDGRRDFNFDNNKALYDVARCYKYWIALTDCDGFRLDTFKHVPTEIGRSFCGTIKEFARNLGKADFFLLAEVGGSDEQAETVRRLMNQNLNATLDIGDTRKRLREVAKGKRPPADYLNPRYLNPRDAWDDKLGSHRNAGRRHVSVLDDHDNLSCEKLRFSTDADVEWQVVAGVALQLFTLSIPCIYYGTEQGFAGPEAAVRQFVPDFNEHTKTDRYLREAMFGPEHPRCAGRGGLAAGDAGADSGLPGFGPFGTAGRHCFDPGAPPFVRIAALIAVRQRFPALRYGRQYQREILNSQGRFELPHAGELIAWSRVLDDEELLCIVNGSGKARRGGAVLVDPYLNDGVNAQFEVIANTEQAAMPRYEGFHPVGQRLPVKLRDGTRYVEIGDLGPSEVIVLANRP